MSQMNLGAKPRNPDPRDWLMSAILPPVDVTKTRQFWTRRVLLDQGAYGTCVANAWTHYLTDGPITHEEKPLLDPDNQPNYQTQGSQAYWPHGWYEDPLAAELYAVRLYDRIHDGILEPLDPERNDGAYTDHGAVILKRRGLISGYYRAASADDVVQAILTTGPVVFSSAWYGSMYNTVLDPSGSGRRYVPVDLGTGIRGYHAYLLDGVNLAPESGEPFVRLHNSWGNTWGVKGCAALSIENLHTLFIQGAWIATEVITS